MKSIKEKAKEVERNTHPLFESFRESDGKLVSVYDHDDMISMFEAGANYVLECIEDNIVNNEDNTLNMAKCLVNCIKQLKEK